jgi:hypothetical protein
MARAQVSTTSPLIDAIKGLSRRVVRLEKGKPEKIVLEELVFRGRKRRMKLTREQKAWVAAELTKQGRLFE